jgi:apolipoprotein N-acyltransferase
MFLPLALLGGFLGSLAFPHPGWWPVLFPSLFILLWSLRLTRQMRHRGFSRFAIGMAWGAGFFLYQLRWLQVPADSPGPWLALCALEIAFICVFAELWAEGDARMLSWGKLGWIARLLWAPVAWLSLEQLRSWVPFHGFPWAKLGFSLVDSPLGAWAPWGGSLGVGGAAVMVVVSCLELFTRKEARVWRLANVVVVVALCVAPAYLQVSLPQKTGEIRVGAVQGNTPGREPQSAFGSSGQVLDNHVRESLRLAQSSGKVDLVLWAENAADIDPQDSSRAAGQLDRVTQAFDAPLLAGTLEETDTGTLRNTILLWDRGQVRTKYSKSHLVPFGEYLPWRSTLESLVPDLASLVPRDMESGDQVAQLSLHTGGEDLVIGTPICYEIADDGLVRQAASGANFLYVPTSNTFFGSSDEAPQQLQIARFRAREHGLDLVQVSTMDSTAYINSRGQVVGKVIQNFESGSFTTPINLREGNTPATVYGSYQEMIVLGLFALVLLGMVVQSVNQRWSGSE